MQLSVFILVLAWSIRLTANLWSYIHLWYVKEYRFDRMLIHLKTYEGRRILFLPFRLPVRSPKTIGLFFLSGASLTFIFYAIKFHLFINLFIIDLFSFPVVTAWVFVLNIPTLLFHRYEINQALTKIRLDPPKFVVGVTGSYGKTSTKEFLGTLLSSHFKIIKTLQSKNSEIAVAETILQKLEKDTDVFVVEMGAYKKNEIGSICKLVRPFVGIVTAINEQHQDLFGSLEATIQAKYELIQSLPQDGIAIFNADNEHTMSMAKKANNHENRRVWMYTITDREMPPWVEKSLSARNIKVGRTTLEFEIISQDKYSPVSLSLLGKHQVQNILAAILGSIACGMTVEEVITAIDSIRPFKSVMEPLSGVNGSLFIDDTFNNNPASAIAALDYLKQQPGKKTVVFQPMIELGSFAHLAHISAGKYAAQVADTVFLTNRNFYEDFVTGINSVKSQVTVKYSTHREIANYIKKHTDSHTVVLFKGKEAKAVLNKLLE